MTSDENLKLVVPSCWATPTDDPNAEPKYYFIQRKYVNVHIEYACCCCLLFDHLQCLKKLQKKMRFFELQMIDARVSRFVWFTVTFLQFCFFSLIHVFDGTRCMNESIHCFRCKVESSVYFYSMNETMFAFRFQSFKFLDSDQSFVYIHCESYICDQRFALI